MAHYVDANGQDRHLEVLIGTVERVRSRLGVDLCDLQSIQEKLSDLPEACRVIHCVEDRPETLLEWSKAHCNVDVIERAIEALLSALLDFFPTRLAEPLRQMMAIASRAKEMERIALAEMPGESQAGSESTREE